MSDVHITLLLKKIGPWHWRVTFIEGDACWVTYWMGPRWWVTHRGVRACMQARTGQKIPPGVMSLAGQDELEEF